MAGDFLKPTVLTIGVRGGRGLHNTPNQTWAQGESGVAQVFQQRETVHPLGRVVL